MSRRTTRRRVVTADLHVVGPVVTTPAVTYVDGAFEGGGAKGFCYLGALDAISRSGIWFDRVAGCSAGAITAALIAAGYRVSTNYRLDVRLAPLASGLRPSRNNSLNQIIFDDNYTRMYDLLASVSQQDIRSSWTKALFDALLPANTVLEPLGNLKTRVRQIPLGFSNSSQKRQARNRIRDWLRAWLREHHVPSIPFINDLPTTAADKIVDTGDWVITPIGRIVRDAALALLQFIPADISLALLSGLYTTAAGDPPPVQGLKTVSRESFAILERGGLLSGDSFRDWMEDHLQARLGAPGGVTGRSAGGYVAFRDLPIDLCVVACCMCGKNELLYFSKKATPGYSVSEAVRRSVSLPVVFIPRRLNEGHPGSIPTALTRHAQHTLVDGGVRVNIPADVFRKEDLGAMDSVPDKRLLCFMLNELEPMPSKSMAGLPIAEDISVPRLDPLAVETVIPQGSGLPRNNYLPPGIDLAMQQVSLAVQAVSSRDNEIIGFLNAMTKTAVVNIGAKDMAGVDPRPWMFHISKKGKKWMAKSGWDAALRCLRELPPVELSRLSVPGANVDPYGP